MLAALGLVGATGLGDPGAAQASEKETSISEHHGSAKPRIVLVHGAWADGTGWQHVIPLLEDDGYIVTAVQNPLSSLADDVATTKRLIDAETLLGPVIAVGHSYGGAVITGAAAGNPNVKALVYLAAFAPEVNEPIGALLPTYPTDLGASLVADAAGFAYIDRAKFRKIFAKDMDRTEARVMAATPFDQSRDLALAKAGGPMDIGWRDEDICDNPRIPAGWAFFGQILAHDMTRDRAPLQPPETLDGLRNYRRPRLDLECVYVDGPLGQPYLYDSTDGDKLLVAPNDLGELNDLPRNHQGIAVIGDQRNDTTCLSRTCM
jgi:pimeloyl-ACP methyl ester carboxylesterase